MSPPSWVDESLEKKRNKGVAVSGVVSEDVVVDGDGLRVFSVFSLLSVVASSYTHPPLKRPDEELKQSV